MDIPHQQYGLRSSLYRPLGDNDVTKVADAALTVLASSGLLVYSDVAYKALIAAGAEGDPESRLVKLPRTMVEDAIASNPSSITLYGRKQEYNCVLEKNRVHYGTGGTAIYVIDPESGERRPSRLEDVILNARMVEELENVHVYTINVFPNDIANKDEIDINRFFHSLDHTTKHVMGGIYSQAGCREVVGMAEILAGSAERLRAEPFVSFITLIISPFKIDGHYGDITCYLAQKGLPVVVPTEPICGTTAPITLAGNVLTHTAETLAGITLVQAVQRGAPGICGSVGSISDLHTMGHVSGAVERAMINAAVAQMAQYFELPLYSTGGMSDAKEVDVQSGYESAMSNLLVAMSGANYIHDAAGLMEFDLTVSYEKLVIDNEILGMCQRVLRGIEVTDDTLGTGMIIEKGPGKDFLAEEHTIRHMSTEFYMPTIANRTPRDQYREEEQALARAHKRVEEFRGREAVACIPEEVRSKIMKEFGTIRTDSKPTHETGQ